MTLFSRWLRRLKAWARSGDIERQMDDEMRLHLELEAQELQLHLRYSQFCCHVWAFTLP